MKGTLAVGHMWAKCSWSWQPVKPLHQGAVSTQLRERSGRFHPLEECVSAGYELKYAVFVEKHFINRPVFKGVFTETTASHRAGECDCGSS